MKNEIAMIDEKVQNFIKNLLHMTLKNCKISLNFEFLNFGTKVKIKEKFDFNFLLIKHNFLIF